MNYTATKEILDVVSKYVDTSNLKVSTVNENWKGENYESDFVEIIKENGISFEVFQGEIIVFFFNDHIHFYDIDDMYDVNYLDRAKDFFDQLFTYEIVSEEYYKGKKLVYAKHGFINSDGMVNFDGYTIIYGLFSLINPFLKKRNVVTVWRFDRESKKFTEVKK